MLRNYLDRYILSFIKPQEHLDNCEKLPDEKSFQSLDSLRTVISEVNDMEHALDMKDITLKVKNLSNGNGVNGAIMARIERGGSPDERKVSR